MNPASEVKNQPGLVPAGCPRLFRDPRHGRPCATGRSCTWVRRRRAWRGETRGFRYDLLLPPAQRPTSFHVGTREFDPIHVGYLTGDTVPDNAFEFSTVDAAGSPIEGNSNLGHDYGNASFSEADRLALVEYMKTL
ncbi:MAG: hypothetical protein ACHQ3O_04865 [Candidatus Limnocylindria bacterium]|jgi:hypothetical protein